MGALCASTGTTGACLAGAGTVRRLAICDFKTWSSSFRLISSSLKKSSVQNPKTKKQNKMKLRHLTKLLMLIENETASKSGVFSVTTTSEFSL